MSDESPVSDCRICATGATDCATCGGPCDGPCEEHDEQHEDDADVQLHAGSIEVARLRSRLDQADRLLRESPPMGKMGTSIYSCGADGEKCPMTLACWEHRKRAFLAPPPGSPQPKERP